MTIKEKYLYSDFHRVFNFKTEERKGTSFLLINTAIANIANAAVSGALHTAFLVENGIDIVRVGVISFIPYMAWLLSIFSPMIMSKFKKRRGILLFNHIFYYLCVVLGTTVGPMLVEGTMAKTVVFAVCLFMGSALNALVGSGATAWHLHFVPQGRDRNVYVSYSNMCSIVLSTFTALIASLVAGSLAGTPQQFWILMGLRLTSFVLFVAGGLMLYLIPKEYEYLESGQKIKLSDAFSQPLKCKPFIMTTLFCVFWGISANMNSSTWNVYLLSTLKFPLWYTYVSSLVCAFGCIFLSTLVRRLIDKISVFRAIMLFLSFLMLGEFASTYISNRTVPLFFIISVMGGVTSVGYNMAYNNLFYLNLPDDANKDLFATFWNLTLNVASFLGMALGTWVLSLFEAHGIYHIAGMDFYGSQLLTTIKGVMYAGMVFYVWKNYRTIQPARAYE